MRTLQEMADDIVAPKYRQPLKTMDEALAGVGWEKVDRPKCCGEEVDVQAFLGAAYFAQCDACGKFIRDIAGPMFGDGHVSMPDGDKVDLGTDKTWICGTQQ